MVLVANASCDPVPNRREYALLLPVHPLYQPENDSEAETAKRVLSELLRYSSKTRMYLPPLADDPPNVLANAVIFDGMAQARLEDVLLAKRVASLSLVGWRIFGSQLRGILTRAGEGEVRLRSGWHSPASPS